MAEELPHSTQPRGVEVKSVIDTNEQGVYYKYYVFGHYPSSCLDLKRRPVYLSKHNVLETGFCLHLQVKPTQLGPIDRASPLSPEK
jgi:hypothetical protein